MRIISKSHDYYDCVQAQGQDLTCVWVRTVEVFYCGTWIFPSLRSSYAYNGVESEVGFVGFCGKVYPYVYMTTRFRGPEKFCYSIEEVDSFVEKNYKDKRLDSYRKSVFHAKHKIGLYRKDVVTFFEKAEASKLKYTNIFVDNHCPVFLAKRYNCRWNVGIALHGRKQGDPVIPNADIKSTEKNDTDWMLRGVEFYRVIPVQQAFQDIHSYLSGVLGFNNPHVPVPDDKTMRDIKGFNDRSFKKDSTKKKS